MNDDCIDCFYKMIRINLIRFQNTKSNGVFDFFNISHDKINTYYILITC